MGKMVKCGLGGSPTINVALYCPIECLPVRQKKSRNGDTLSPIELIGWPDQDNQGDQGGLDDQDDRGDQGER